MVTQIFRPESFKKSFKKLPKDIQKKFEKQLNFLVNDERHPSLRARKKEGSDIYEARVDYHNRFTYRLDNERLELLTVGPHDEGLGKK